jgi:hypothetical protein
MRLSSELLGPPQRAALTKNGNVGLNGDPAQNRHMTSSVFGRALLSESSRLKSEALN